MRTVTMTRGILGALTVVAIAACSDDGSTAPERPPTELNILRLDSNHPPFEQATVSFWARVNQSREGKIYFQNGQGGRGEEFARLKIDSGSLLSRPDGSSFGTNDSILITMSVVDPNRVLVELQPAGLRFRSDKPAELKLEYGEADEDYDDDGDIDDDDESTEQKFAIWRQEKAGDPYVQLGSVKFEDSREIEAKLVSFSRYAIAY